MGAVPSCPKNVRAWSIKMGICTSAKEGLNSELFACPFVIRIMKMLVHVWIFVKKKEKIEPDPT